MKDNIVEYVGKSLYQLNILKERKRYLVYRFRCWSHGSQVKDLLDFFDKTPERLSLLEGNPSFLEQTTRAFFYKASTWEERVELVKQHVELLEELFDCSLLEKLYVKEERVRVWEDQYLEKPIGMDLLFRAGQRKEGCLTLALNYEGEDLYQIMLWLAKDKVSKNNVIYIGALQGTPNGSEIIKGLTKAFFGYRTKNLIFYGLRSFARVIEAEKIYAVGNEGYYAMNHIRMDRKLKTDFGAFWEECEGSRCEDKRFYVMPVEEYRKDMSELKPSKRAQHRKRFAKMDEIKASLAESLGKYKK